MPHLPDCCSTLGLAAALGLLVTGCDLPDGSSPSRPIASGPTAFGSGDSAEISSRPAGAAPLPDGRELLLTAIAALENNHTVQAAIRHEATLLGRRVVGRGIYLEQQAQPRRRTRLELSTQMGQESGTLVQVCDGKLLWTYDSLAEQPRAEKIDLARLEEALGKQGTEPFATLAGLPPLYGLPKLLAAISRHYQFARATPGRWGPARQPVWKLDGRRVGSGARASAERDSQANTSSPAAGQPDQSPSFVPDLVVVLLDQQNLFPLRIEFRWTRPAVLGDGAAVIVDFYDVKLHAPIDPSRFSYRPGNLEVVDQTRQTIERLCK